MTGAHQLYFYRKVMGKGGLFSYMIGMRFWFNNHCSSFKLKNMGFSYSVLLTLHTNT